MNDFYTIYSTYYLEQEVSNYNCYVIEHEWTRLHNEIKSNRIIGVIQNNNKSWTVTLGQPVQFENQKNKNVFIPHWMLEQIYLEGSGETVEIQWMPCDVFDNSEHIQLKLLDGNYTNDDIEEKLSIELTKLGVLQKDTVIEINIDETLLKYRVENLIPASVVLCEGDSVSLEFIEDVVIPPSAPQVESAVPPSAPPIETDEKTLGGVKHEGRYNPWRSKDFKPPNS